MLSRLLPRTSTAASALLPRGLASLASGGRLVAVAKYGERPSKASTLALLEVMPSSKISSFVRVVAPLSTTTPKLIPTTSSVALGLLNPVLSARTFASSAPSTTANSAPSANTQNGESNYGGAVREEVIEKPDKVIAWWLFIVAGLVFVMVVVGGLTRLTKSGLSMVHWKFTGEQRPVTAEDWAVEFDRYKESPEYKIHNTGMTMEEFKFIYHMEYGHRTLGRIIGLAFGGPLVYFLASKRVRLSSPLAKRLGVLFLLGGGQGLIGWWMVKSGLDLPDNSTVAKVSPYRLATHLISAFALYCVLMYTGLRCLHGKSKLFDAMGKKVRLGSGALRHSAHAVASLAFLTAFSGAFVAGNEAGLIYNEWPLMGGSFIPSDLINPYVQPVWKNAFEHPTFVQFEHRLLAYSTTAATLAAFVLARRMPAHLLTPAARRAVNLVSLAVATQVTLGLSTLLMHVPVPLASAHQAGAMAVLTSALYLMFLLHNPLAGGARFIATTAAAAATAGSAAPVTASTASGLLAALCFSDAVEALRDLQSSVTEQQGAQPSKGISIEIVENNEDALVGSSSSQRKE